MPGKTKLVDETKPPVPVSVSGIHFKLFPHFREGDDNVFEVECELNKVGEKNMMWWVASLLSGTKDLDIFTLMDREDYKDQRHSH